MNLTLDIGNTRAKAAIFHGGDIIEAFGLERSGACLSERLSERYGRFDAIALSTTRCRDVAFEAELASITNRLIVVNRETPVPLSGVGNAPRTLGADRLAAAVGAVTLFEGKDVMIVDFGTAITVDRVTRNGEYVYGVISPGARLRFESLNRLTANLPLCSLTEEKTYLKNTTQRSIFEGVVSGIIFEIEGYMNRMEKENESYTTIFSGGDAKFFENRIKNTIFAKLDLIFVGLNRIIEYNAIEKNNL